MKERFAAAGVPVPWFQEIATPQELQRIAIERGRDLVIKPVDSRGSRGVQRVAQVEDLAKAFFFARSHSPSERVMVEQYLSGPQVSTESVVVDGSLLHARLLGPQLRISRSLRARSSSRMAAICRAICRPRCRPRSRQLVGQAAAALGIVNGTVKGDIVIHDGEPHVIELAARLSGGFFCTREIPLEHRRRFRRRRHPAGAGRDGVAKPIFSPVSSRP